MENTEKPEFSISAVIGVLLMIAVTVSLVSLITITAFNIGDGDVSEPAQASVEVKEGSNGITASVIRNDNAERFILKGPTGRTADLQGQEGKSTRLADGAGQYSLISVGDDESKNVLQLITAGSTVKYDGSKPKINSFSASNPIDRDILIEIDSSESLSNIEVRITGNGNTLNVEEDEFTEKSGVYEAVVSVGSDGSYTAELLRAEDQFGKDGSSGETDSVSISTDGSDDSSAPTITSYSVSNPIENEVQVSFNSNEKLSTISVDISGAETATLTESDFSEDKGTYSTTYLAGNNGDYTATLDTAEDDSGNDGASSQSGTVTVSQDGSPDTTNPSITSFSAENPINQDIEVSFNSDELLSNIRVDVIGPNDGTLTEGDFTENSGEYVARYDSGSDGDYTIELINAEDDAGNDGATGQSDTVTVSSDDDQPSTGGDGGDSDTVEGDVGINPDIQGVRVQAIHANGTVLDSDVTASTGKYELNFDSSLENVIISINASGIPISETADITGSKTVKNELYAGAARNYNPEKVGGGRINFELNESKERIVEINGTEVSMIFGSENGDIIKSSTPIANVHMLQAINKSSVEETGLVGDYTLVQNIDASATKQWNSGNGFEPIGHYDFVLGEGSTSDPFKGTIDGNNLEIKNLHLTRTSGGKKGMIALTSAGSKVENLGIRNADIETEDIGGVLAGESTGVINNTYVVESSIKFDDQTGMMVGNLQGEIKNSYTKGSIQLSSGNPNSVGGIAGDATSPSLIENSNSSVDIDVPSGSEDVGGIAGTSGVVRNSSASGDISATGDEVGGLVGQADGDIERSYATGNVSGDSDVGGLVGTSSEDIIVSKSFATGDVSLNDDGQGNRHGGLLGKNRGTVINSYSTGNVTNIGSNQNHAGLVGLNSDVVEKSYSVGNVTSDGSNVGGLIGDERAQTRDSYWDIESSTTTQSENGTGLSTNKMQGKSAESNMNGFDFTGTDQKWNVSTNPDNYPILVAIERDVQIKNR